MTDNSNETTEVLPTVEMPAVEPAVAGSGPAVATPATAYKTPEMKPVTSTSKVLIIVAAAVLGFVVLGATFASGVMVGSHVGGMRGGPAITRQGQLGGPGGPGGQLGAPQGRDFEQDGGRGHGRGGRGGYGGQNGPQGQMPPQGQGGPQGQVPPQGQAAPDGSTGQSQ
jgi:hypothetical protein